MACNNQTWRYSQFFHATSLTNWRQFFVGCPLIDDKSHNIVKVLWNYEP